MENTTMSLFSDFMFLVKMILVLGFVGFVAFSFDSIRNPLIELFWLFLEGIAKVISAIINAPTTIRNWL